MLHFFKVLEPTELETPKFYFEVAQSNTALASKQWCCFMGKEPGVRLRGLTVFLHFLCIFGVWKVMPCASVLIHNELSETLTWSL